ncbi:MAG: TetR/AcrR family transcriptional regulator [Alphaproteobacteria bacterium]|nr:TetR/AcrR family transcriptional regulator [Alphaproteobacteria bacterium]
MPQKKVPRKKDIPERITAAALDLAAEKGWRNVSMNAIAERVGISLADLYALHPHKEAVLNGFSRHVNTAVLAALDSEDIAETPRDRLFAVLMARLDALAPHKAGIAAVARDCGCDLPAMAAGACRLAVSMSWMLEAAGISSAGLHGLFRVKGLAVIWLAVLRVWFGDDDPHMAKTMAALDRWLRRADNVEKRLGALCVPSPKDSEAGPESAAPA